MMAFYTLCPKNVTNLSCYNCDEHESILITFGRNNTEILRNQKIGLLFSYKQCFCATWRNTKPGNYVFSLKLNATCFLPKTHETHFKIYHLVTAEQPFIVKTIDCMQQTLLKKERSTQQYVTLTLTFTKYVTVSVAV